MIRRGQGLLETIFAIGIMLVALTAVLALTVSNSTGQEESEFQVVANNLAREGIEVIRSQRDANWLAAVAWDTNIPVGTVTTQFNASSNTWTIVENATDDQLYLSADGIYSHDGSGRPTGYHRTITIDAVCVPSDGSAGAETVSANCGSTEKKIGITIHSRVTWNERGRSRAIELTDVLYAWK